MADLSTTMRRARRTLPANAPSTRIEIDVAERLKGLDRDQLEQVAEALGRQVGGADEGALRRSISAYVDEWANDVVDDDREGDPEAARAAGRKEALGFLEEEASRAQERRQELDDQGVDDGVLDAAGR